MNQDDEQEGTGKKRKHLEQKQYFKGTKLFSDDYLEEINHKYSHFDLKTLE